MAEPQLIGVPNQSADQGMAVTHCQTQELRRSPRLRPEPNGRDYLADLRGWSREELEEWIQSPPVQEHLLLWYNICIVQAKRYNSSIEWINEGDKGYFYDPNGLEEDLLLLCLAEGDGRPEEEYERPHHTGEEERAAFATPETTFPAFADKKVMTASWTAEELWARTAWRIVQDSRSDGPVFAAKMQENPAACYAFVIDMLCLAFHSIAFRDGDSCWAKLICGPQKLAAANIEA